MSENGTQANEKKPNENSNNSETGWTEFDKFKKTHELQLFGMQFPPELYEKLYVKLKNELFDTQNFFEIFDNQDEDRYLLKAKQDLKKNDLVFLVDHCWTFRIRQFNEFCEKYPNIIKRTITMLKYGQVKKKIINTLEKDKKKEDINSKKVISLYNNEIAASEEKQKIFKL